MGWAFRIHPTCPLRVVKGVLKEASSPRKRDGEHRAGNPCLPVVFLPRKQDKKLACLNVQGCNDPAKCECVGRLYEWKRCVREWKEVFSRLMYVRMNVGESEYVCLSGCEV